MSLWAVMPAKDFADGKSRLKPALSDAARRDFARRLFDHVLGTLAQVVDGVLVCTDSPEVAEAAARHGAEALPDAPGKPTLAQIVDGGLRQLATRQIDAALVLMADLPRLRADDVRQIVAPLAGHDLVLVRAQDGRHTNALALSPPGRIATCFGRADSFAAHLAAARAAALRVAVVENARVAFDVDGPDDHALLMGV
jgi:2-phospho-L-lactate guanylyltransferase